MVNNHRRLGYREALPGMFGLYVLIGMWEFITTPLVSHHNTWQGVWLSLIALPVGAFRNSNY